MEYAILKAFIVMVLNGGMIMEDIRSLGNKIRQIAIEHNISEKNLADCLKLTISDMNMGLAGRKYFSYPQLEKIAECFDVPVEILFNSKNEEKYAYSIDFMNKFTNNKNLEDVLDIIYDYLDVLDSVNN